VSHTFDPGTRLVRVSVTDTRAKVRNLRRDPRASFYVTSRDFWRWAVADGIAELTPVATDPQDATVEELIEVYRAIAGEHPDWDDFRRAMVADRRLVFRLRLTFGRALRRNRTPRPGEFHRWCHAPLC
jgi:PPOX class probable F420-dependent enzyme